MKLTKYSFFRSFYDYWAILTDDSISHQDEGRNDLSTPLVVFDDKHLHHCYSKILLLISIMARNILHYFL